MADQLHGDLSKHAEVRATVVTYIRENKDLFVPFLVAGESTKERSNLSRTAAPKRQTESVETPSETLARLMDDMAKAGVWGSEREVAAAAYAYDCNVVLFDFWSNGYKVYQPANATKRYIHLAYGGPEHEHYFSIRKQDGTHDGLAELGPSLIDRHDTSDVSRATDKQIGTIKDALAENGVDTEIGLIKDVLEKCRGDLDTAFSRLIDQRTSSSSRSSSQHSSGSKRSADESDTQDQTRSKRRDTRLSLRRRARVDVVRGEADSIEVAFHVRVNSPDDKLTGGEAAGTPEDDGSVGVSIWKNGKAKASAGTTDEQ